MTLFAGLAAAVFVLANLWWLVAGVLLVMAVHVVRSVFASAVEQREVRLRRLAVIAARADREHAAVLAGDESGVYGEYPPSA